MSAVDVEINPYLLPFVQHHRRFKVIYGGRGSGKTVSVARIMAAFCMSGEKICCFRQFWSSIEDSQYTEIVDQINELGLQGFEIQATRIFHESGGHIKFKGLDRNISNIKGLKGFNKFWVEEAQDLKEKALRDLTPTLRENKSECWLTANPQRREDPLSQRFIERTLTESSGLIAHDEMIMRIKLNYTENPWFPESLDSERRDDFKRLDRALYNHIWLGDYNDSVEDSVIKAEWVDAAIGAHERKGSKWSKFGEVVGIHDPADTGDAKATLIKHGNIYLQAFNDTKRRINDALDFSLEQSRIAGATSFIIDSDGCGLGLKRQVDDFFDDRVNVYQFRGNATAQRAEEVVMIDSAGRNITNRQYYKNIRSQCYALLAKRFENTYNAVENGDYIDPHDLISISSDCENLNSIRSELSAIPRQWNSSNVYQIMSKKDMMSKLKIKSPNLADCFMMSQIELKSRKAMKSMDEYLDDRDFA